MVDPDVAFSWVFLGLPFLFLVGVIVTIGVLARGRARGAQRGLSRWPALIAVVLVGVVVSPAATATVQAYNFALGDMPAEVDPRLVWVVAARSAPAWVASLWIINAEVAPPMLVATLVAIGTQARHRRAALIVGGLIAVLPTLLTLLLDLSMWIRFALTGRYY